MAPCRQPVACALRFARQSSRRLKNVCRHLIMNHSSPRFVNKATTIEIFGKLRGIATEHFLDHRISGLMMVQYYPTSHQQMWMPCSQIMEQLRARHRLRWHRQSAGSRYTWDFRFQRTAIKSTSTMILSATCKSYTLVPHGFRSIFRASEQNSGILPLIWLLAATWLSESLGPNFEKKLYRASKITWRQCDLNN